MKKVYLKEDVILPILKDYGFKEKELEKKKIYTGNGYEVDFETREIKSTSKSDLTILIELYDRNYIECK